MNIRKLRADEIDCRIGQIKKDGSGLSLLLYKDARCDMNILDETFGSMNWKRRHTRDNANCIVSIWDAEKKEWIDKEDTGTESNAEAEKGLASDSFKRACVNVGIGRELYTSPFIWITKDRCEIKKNDNGRFVCFNTFTVTEIAYDEAGNICKLAIKNDKTGMRVFDMSAPLPPVQPTTTPEQFICADCGRMIMPIKFNGEEFPVRRIAEMAEKKYGRKLCWDCCGKAKVSNGTE